MRNLRRTITTIAVAAAMLAMTATVADVAPSLTIDDLTPAIGQTVILEAAFPNGTGNAHFYVGESGGTTQVTIGTQLIILPMKNASLIGTGVLQRGAARISWMIPVDRSLIGTSCHFIGVKTSSGRTVQTSLVSSGPIIGDDIS